MTSVTGTRAPGPLAEWLRRSTWVDHILLAIRVVVATLVIVGVVGSILADTYSAANWISFIVFGLTIGSVYALIALGYTMVYGILRMINFAHGDVMMVGSFAGLFAADALNKAGATNAVPLLALPLVLAAGMAAGGLVSMAIERVAYRPFLHVRSLAPLICAIGLTFVLQYSARGLFGTRNRAYPGFGWMEGSVTVFGTTFQITQLIAFAAAIIMLAGLLAVVRLTPLGKAMRAVAEDRDAAALVGIDVGRVIVATFAIGGAMAGVAGVLYALVFKQITVFMGFFLGVKGFAAAILGGIGNLGGAMLGGLVLGLAEALGPALLLEGFNIPAPYQLKDVIGYGMLVMILIFRPQGLLGERLSTKRA
ncbi:branched-chain amino acid transport system permease protein [Pseudoxanthobacter soli DSM 19599]|uniref:Branched-chain amino acid transport system permease protein n=1 Tax=Pseudoxanthobacter soli DSM 19599 TaxID=1123029 RepID=A0A1M7ZRE1_9HYPH|nr:branched-chain amino acid ABC transporter permease [Pseudoxanthobacter soli]SHO67473.1 branched-chain amino acid transport system permease protein [Pseudoxanthobacter soli DSM 19599]